MHMLTIAVMCSVARVAAYGYLIAYSVTDTRQIILFIVNM